MRPRGAAAAAPALAGRAAPGGRSRCRPRPWPASCPPGTGSASDGAAALDRLLEVRRPARRALAAPGARSSSATCWRPGCADYPPRLLDELVAMGEVVWVGRGPLGHDDGRVALYLPRRRGRGWRRDPSGEPPAGRAARGAPGAPGAARRVLLPRAVRAPAGGGDQEVARRPLGPGVGRRGDQRLVRAAARAARRRPRRRPRRDAGRPRCSASGRPAAAGPLVAGAAELAASPPRHRRSGCTRRPARSCSATAC